jgi:outer membrane protein TolC
VDLNEKLVKNQVALKDAVLSAQYELSKLEQQYLEAQKNRELARSYFNFLLNKDLNTEILIDSTIINALPVVGTIDFYQNWAQSNRPEFEQINSGKLVNLAVLHLQQKNEKLPQVFLGGNWPQLGSFSWL